MNEFTTSAVLLVVCGLLLVTSVVASRGAQRTGVPVALLFLALGMLAGEDGLLGIEFADYGLAFKVGTLALVLILLDCGLNTRVLSPLIGSDFRPRVTPRALWSGLCVHGKRTDISERASHAH